MNWNFKKVKKYTVLLLVFIGIFLVNTFIGNAALTGWDLVDSGKHLDWDGNTKYTSSVNSAIKLWEGHRSGVIRPDNAWRIEDVYVSDYYKPSNVMGFTSSAGIIKFNKYKFNEMTSGEKLKCATHEFGHALGLDHSNGSEDVMFQGQFENTKLTKSDKKSYDAAYKNY